MIKDLKIKLITKKKNIKSFLLSIPKDLSRIPFAAKIAIICLGIFMLWNTFFDLNHFINPTLYPSIWTIINRQTYHPWQQLLLFLNGIVGFTNVICIVLISFGKISNFFWGFFAVSIYGCIALVWDYVGDMQLNLFFFLPFQFIGYSLWKFHLDSQQEIISKSLKLKASVVTIYFAIVLSVFFYFEIPEFSRVILGGYDFDGNTFQQILPHVLDSLTNSLSIIAQLLMLLRFREQWIFWMIINICQIIMYSGIAHSRLDVNLLLMWIVALGNSGLGFYQWFFVRSKEKMVVKKETFRD